MTDPWPFSRRLVLLRDQVKTGEDLTVVKPHLPALLSSPQKRKKPEQAPGRNGQEVAMTPLPRVPGRSPLTRPHPHRLPSLWEEGRKAPLPFQLWRTTSAPRAFPEFECLPKCHPEPAVRARQRSPLPSVGTCHLGIKQTAKHPFLLGNFYEATERV